MLRLVENARRKQIAWIRTILERTGWTQTELARRAGISHATLSRFLTDPENTRELDTATVGKIMVVSPIPHYENRRGLMPQGFDEAEASVYDGAEDAVVTRVLAAVKGLSNHIELWQLHSSALENAGYIAGDILIVDFSARPQPGDVVCAQVYDTMGSAETAFRIYHRPYLVASSNNPRHLAPVLIDDRVDIRGVVMASVRPRPSLLAAS